MKSKIIAVISDLHIGEEARSKDLCPPSMKSAAIESNYRETFRAFTTEFSIRADYLLVAGDVTTGAQPDEVKLASEVILETADALDVPSKKIVFVPGNHDVDWEVLKIEDKTNFRHTQRYAPLRGRDWIFEQIMLRGCNHICEEPYFSSWEDDNLLVMCYNSSWDDDPKLAPHRGSVKQDHLRKLAEKLGTTSNSSSQLRIFLVHHHPLQYTNPIPDDPDFSIMINAENLLTLLQSYSFDVLIHGHKHSPRFKVHISDSAFPLAILCSGSFSAVLDPRWSGLVNNQFHILKIAGRDTESQCVYGEVENWTYICGHGWKPSKSHNGIEHKCSFGTYLLPKSLKSKLRSILENEFKDTKYVKWSTIISKFPRFQYLPLKLLTNILDDLAPEVGLKKYGGSLNDIYLGEPEDDHE